MTIIKETKYLIFLSSKFKGRKTKHISIVNKNSGEEIATIDWYRQWRQYCFMPEPFFRTVWNNTCLTDVISVLNELMKEREINKPERE